MEKSCTSRFFDTTTSIYKNSSICSTGSIFITNTVISGFGRLKFYLFGIWMLFAFTRNLGSFGERRAHNHTNSKTFTVLLRLIWSLQYVPENWSGHLIHLHNLKNIDQLKPCSAFLWYKTSNGWYSWFSFFSWGSLEYSVAPKVWWKNFVTLLNSPLRQAAQHTPTHVSLGAQLDFFLSFFPFSFP